jgi:hypothetical protein
VVVVRASNVAPSPAAQSGGAADANTNAAPLGDTSGGGRSLATFVQLRFGRQLLRTPVRHHTGDPTWEWSWSLALPAPVGDLPPRHDGLVLRVCDAKSLGEPVVLGSCEASGVMGGAQHSAAVCRGRQGRPQL